MLKHEIRKFTAISLNAAKVEWRKLAGDDEFTIEYEVFFAWCTSHIEHREGDSQAWELFNVESDQCDAIIELVNGKRGALTKLLKLYVSPRFWEGVGNKRDELLNLYTDTFNLVIAKGLFGGAKDVKLYGRTDLMLGLLRSLHAHWSVDGTTAEFEGRFLKVSITR